MKTIGRIGIVVAACVTVLLLGSQPGCDSGKKDGDSRSDQSSTAPKPFKIYWAIMGGDRKIGYGVVAFRVEEGKAVTEVEANYPWQGNDAGETVRQPFSIRHVETLDGRPVSFRRAFGAHIVTCVGDSDGKARITQTDANGTKTTTIGWPEGAILSHAQRLLARRRGLKEGTTYAYKECHDPSGELWETRVRIGPKAKVDVLGRTLMLTKITSVYKRLSDPTQGGSTVSYVDDDFRPHKTTATSGPKETTWFACSREEAMRKPRTAVEKGGTAVPTGRTAKPGAARGGGSPSPPPSVQEQRDFLESLKTARAVGTGSIHHQGLVSARDFTTRFTLGSVEWETLLFGLPQEKFVYETRRTELPEGTRPRFTLTDKVLISVDPQRERTEWVILWSKDLERKVRDALSRRHDALVKKHGAETAWQIERVIGILGQMRTSRDFAGEIVALKGLTLPMLQAMEARGQREESILAKALPRLKWKLTAMELIRQWARPHVKGTGDKPYQLPPHLEWVKDPAVNQVLGDAWVLCRLRCGQYPVVTVRPDPLGSGNLFAVNKKDKTVRHMASVDDLKKFFLANVRVTGEKFHDKYRNLETTVAAWVTLWSTPGTDGFVQFKIDKRRIDIVQSDGWKVTAQVKAAEGARGQINMRMEFDGQGKMVSIAQDEELKPRTRPTYPVSKLVDPDPAERQKVERQLRAMGTTAREHLLEQRAKGPPEVQRAIDRVWREIATYKWRRHDGPKFREDELILPSK